MHRPTRRLSLSLAALLASLAAVSRISAHDTWVQASAALVRPDDLVHVDLCLGNHGNEHRDFKLAGKLGSLEGVTLAVVAPDGRATDLVPALVDLGYAPKEGFWSGRFVVAAPGLHCVAHTRAGLRHGKRSVKSGKAYFLAAESRDTLPEAPAAPTPLGHPLEIVPETHPVVGMGPGRDITVRVLFRGRPVADQRVSFIPRGATLAADFDPEFERRTDDMGRCRYTPREGNFLLVVTRVEVPEEKGDGFDGTTYGATLFLDVPQRCTCCE